MTYHYEPAGSPHTDQPDPARARLIAAARTEFSEKGFSGASVRAICARASTSSNMIHHYFGSKQALYDEVLSGFSDGVFSVPIRIISEPPASREIFVTRFKIFVAETLEALVAQGDLYSLIVREKVIFEVFSEYNARLIGYLEAAKKAGIVRVDLDTEMLTGLIFDRLSNQILFEAWIKESTGESVLSSEKYKNRWLKANLDLILRGILAPIYRLRQGC